MKTREMIAELLTELTPEEVKQMVDVERQKKESELEKKAKRLDGARADVVIAIVQYLETLGILEDGMITEEEFEQFKDTLVELEPELLHVAKLETQLSKVMDRGQKETNKAVDPLDDFLRSIS